MVQQKRLATGVAIVVVSIVMSVALRAQETVTPPPADAPFLLGPLTLAPVIDSYIGHDDNLFNQSSSANPQGDITGTFSPMVNAWLTTPRARANVRARSDLYYYGEFSDLSALDWNVDARIELPLNRLVPFVSSGLVKTNNSQNLEVDAYAGLMSTRYGVGTSIRLTSRISTEISVRRSQQDYDEQALYEEDLNLSETLDYASTGVAIALRYRLTPLTTVGVEAARSQDRFESATDRDSNNRTITPFIELRPLALISGRVSVGVQSRNTLSGDTEDFNGTVVNTSLTYTLLGRTQLSLSLNRALQYSYLEGRTDYVDGRITVGVVHQLTDSWDVTGSIGRGRIDYRDTIPAGGSDTAVTPVQYPNEKQLVAGAGAGYRRRRTRVGFRVEYSRRDPESSTLGGYTRTRALSSVTYTF